MSAPRLFPLASENQPRCCLLLPCGGVFKASRFLLSVALAIAALVPQASAQEAPSLVVTISADSVDNMDNETSLREAIAYAGTLGGANTVTFAPPLNGTTIALTSGFSITGDGGGLTIDATALAGGLTIQSNAGTRAVVNTGILTLRGLTLTGAALTGGQGGGAIYTNHTLTIDRCTITGNSTDFGGGAIFNDGTTTILRSTLSGNSSAGTGGGIYNSGGSLTIEQSTISGNSSGGNHSIFNNATLTLRHCTIADNTASGGSGAINNQAGRTLNLENCIIGDGNTGADLVNEGTVNYIGANLVEFVSSGGGTFNGTAPIVADPMLSPLAGYGGPTHTMPPMEGSPAIDAAAGSSEVIDQRGEIRPVDGEGNGVATNDLGAVEITSDNANLEALVLSSGTIAPALDPLITRYVADSAVGTTSITVTPTSAHADATVMVNGIAVASGEASGSIPLNLGVNVITVVVTSPLGGTKTYTLVVNRPTHVVTTAANDGAGSLRQLLQDLFYTNQPVVIVFASNLNGATIQTDSTLVQGNSNGGVFTIDASGLPDGIHLVKTGGGSSSVFQNSGFLTIRGVSFSGGNTGFFGGGMDNSGTLTMEQCTISGNSAGIAGGGIVNTGSTVLRNCTISGNTTVGTGNGAAAQNSYGTLRLEHCTVVDNHASYSIGGVYNYSGTVELENSIVARNTAGISNAPGDFQNYGTLLVNGSNIIESAIVGNVAVGSGSISQVNPLLGPLADNGGPNLTCYPAGVSPVIDAAVGSTSTSDQRSRPRPFDGDSNGSTITDIGAVEYSGSINANLSSLAISSGTLAPTLTPGTTIYRVVVPDTTTEITITPTAADATSTITVNGVSLASGVESASIPIGAGDNLIEIVVTPQDALQAKIYTIVVTYPSNNANLAALTLSQGTLSPTFSGATLAYIAQVPYDATSITVTPTTDSDYASVTVNGTPVGSGEPSGPINLNVGNNAITVEVTAEDGESVKNYSLTVQRRGNADLSGLQISDGTLEPAFDGETTGYVVILPTSKSSLTVTPTAAEGSSTITVNGNAVASGAESDPIALTAGLNTITIIVFNLPGPGIMTYTVVAVNPYKVTSTADSGAGSLRQAILDTNATDYADMIEFDPSLNGQTITISGGTMAINKPCSIDASALADGVVLHGNLFAPMFGISSGVAVDLRNLSITNSGNPGSENTGAIYSFGPLGVYDCKFYGNHAPAGYGGAIYAGSSLIMERCSVTGNSALYGGGVALGGAAAFIVSHCTFNANISFTNGGGILNLGGQLTVNHCTLSGNSASEAGGGIAVLSSPATLSLKNSIVSGNIAANSNPNIHNLNSVILLGSNIVGNGISGLVDDSNGSVSTVDPVLGPIGDHGGATFTFPLLKGSPAINASSTSTAVTDQRGFPVVGVADIGAYESGNYPSPTVYLLETLPADSTFQQRAPTFDYDGDGKTNEDEWLALTDPNNPNSRLAVADFVANGAAFDVTVPSVVGRRYLIQTSPSMAPGTWSPVGSGFDGNGGEVTTTIGPFPEMPKVFVRVGVSLP